MSERKRLCPSCSGTDHSRVTSTKCPRHHEWEERKRNSTVPYSSSSSAPTPPPPPLTNDKKVDDLVDLEEELPYLSISETKEGEEGREKSKGGKWDTEVPNWILSAKEKPPANHWVPSGFDWGPMNVPSTLSGPQIFDLLWPWKIWEELARGTMKKLKESGRLREEEEGGKKRKRNLPAEILRFFAAWIAMGLAPEPTVREYFAPEGTHELYGSTFIRSVVSVHLFEQISGHLRWPDREGIQSEDKVLELEEILNRNFKLYWQPRRTVVVDEIMLLFKGRFKYRQHVRGKPKATGLKLFAIADSNHYLWHFFLYRGKGQTIVKTVWSLVKTLPFYSAGNYVVIADSYFGGLELAYVLLFSGVHFILACKNDRPAFLFDSTQKKKGKGKGKGKEKEKEKETGKEQPPEHLLLFKPALRRNDWRTAWRPLSNWSSLLPKIEDAVAPDPIPRPLGDVRPIGATTWYDRKRVNFLHDVYLTGEETHKSRAVPLVSRVYNEEMGAVDSFDKILQQYFNRHRSKRWTRTLIMGLFKITTVNAYKIYEALNGKDDYKTFLFDLACALRARAFQLEALEQMMNKLKGQREERR